MSYTNENPNREWKEKESALFCVPREHQFHRAFGRNGTTKRKLLYSPYVHAGLVDAVHCVEDTPCDEHLAVLVMIDANAPGVLGSHPIGIDFHHDSAIRRGPVNGP